MVCVAQTNWVFEALGLIKCFNDFLCLNTDNGRNYCTEIFMTRAMFCRWKKKVVAFYLLCKFAASEPKPRESLGAA